MLEQALRAFEGRSLFKPKYENFIGGAWVAPLNGQYFDNISPVTGKPVCCVARGCGADTELALDAAHRAKGAWGKSSPGGRARVLSRIADRIEANLDLLALVETIDNGKPIREAMAADLPLAVDQFRCFAGAVRAQEGSLSETDRATIANRSEEPPGVIGQIIPWSFPILIAARSLAPALAAGNCVVLKPAEQTPMSIMALMELIGDLLPEGVVNVVNGFDSEAGRALAASPRIASLAFTGATGSPGPCPPEQGGESFHIVCADVMRKDDALLDKALESLAMFALNQGEVCTFPTRALVHQSIYDRFMARAIERVEAIRPGNPLDPATIMGAQVSAEQLEKVLTCIDIGRFEGAHVLTGGARHQQEGELSEGYYVQPTVIEGHRGMQVFRQPIPGPVLCVTTFTDDAEALRIVGDTGYGPAAGVWSRDVATCDRYRRAFRAGRLRINDCPGYPAHAAFGGEGQTGADGEHAEMALGQYQQGRRMAVSRSEEALGLS